MNKRNGFSLIELIFVIVVMGIISSFVYPVYTVFFDYERDKKEETNVISAVNSSIIYYENNGTYPTSIEDLENYTTFELYDKNKNKFEIVKNGDNSLFKESGDSTAKYAFALVSVGVDNTLDTQINGSNEIEVGGDDSKYLLTANSFQFTKRYETIQKLNTCKTRVSAYETDTLLTVTGLSDLTTNNYIKSYDTYDHYGRRFILDTANKYCYSVGYNGVDDSKSVDDILPTI